MLIDGNILRIYWLLLKQDKKLKILQMQQKQLIYQDFLNLLEILVMKI
nr:MAG TPA: PLK4, STIL-box, Complex, transferase.6A [Crassvirales sp.]